MCPNQEKGSCDRSAGHLLLFIYLYSYIYLYIYIYLSLSIYIFTLVDSPVVTLSIEPRSVLEGERVTFTCQATANPPIMGYRSG